MHGFARECVFTLAMTTTDRLAGWPSAIHRRRTASAATLPLTTEIVMHERLEFLVIVEALRGDPLAVLAQVIERKAASA
jgi:hypothetical protein